MNGSNVLPANLAVSGFILLAVGGALLGLSTSLVKYAAIRGLSPLTLFTWSVVGAALVVTTVNAVTGRRPRSRGSKRRP